MDKRPASAVNWLDRTIAYFSPKAGESRAVHRIRFNTLARVSRTGYDAAEPSRKRKFHRNDRSGDSLARLAGMPLRNQARHLDRNHDIAKGALDRLVDFMIGPTGIQIEPQPKRRDGTIHTEYARRLQRRWQKWTEWPEVTWTHDWIACQRIACRSWLRDGEILGQLVTGFRSDLTYGSAIPVALEMLEADFLPLKFDDPARNIRQGIERNAWGRPVAYHLYKNHPGDYAATYDQTTKRVPAERMIHVRLTDRFHTLRGVSVMASVIERMEDLAEYEEAERIAAKMGASMVMKLTHGAPEMFGEGTGGAKPHDPSCPPIYQTEAGMIVVSTQQGAEADFFDTKRPNPNAMPFVQGNLRGASAGFGLSYSSMARDYNGTYSAQRQELVENRPGYEAGTMIMVAQMVRPTYQTVVDWDAMLEPIPADVDPDTIHDALYQGPPMIWIDPSREADANLVLTQAGFTSRSAVIRSRGGNPEDVDQQRKADREREQRLGLGTAVSPAKSGTDPAQSAPGEAGEDGTTADANGDRRITDMRRYLASRESARLAAETQLEHS